MIVDTVNKSSAIYSVMKQPDQVIFLDANILIPPSRDEHSFDTDKYISFFLEPLFNTFSNLSLHMAVKEEILNNKINRFLDKKISRNPCMLRVYNDKCLSDIEQALRNTFESEIRNYSYFSPELNSKKDLGEVKTLSFMATKGYKYFVSNDSSCIAILKSKNKFNDCSIICMYELIYLLSVIYPKETEYLRKLYKFLYYLTPNEKRKNPCWSEYIDKMKVLYSKLAIKPKIQP